ncbi:hypothetical protein PR048_023728 [Dryococelus australis]|uniref:Uncharacterized protein n=1 Tax=Dryococelus australis TaxID=614101 RepID=A0ABQ9GUX8_9NEOP|nr:hypothetical protein PR048_023728 [Dryococelus australis]
MYVLCVSFTKIALSDYTDFVTWGTPVETLARVRASASSLFIQPARDWREILQLLLAGWLAGCRASELWPRQPLSNCRLSKFRKLISRDAIETHNDNKNLKGHVSLFGAISALVAEKRERSKDHSDTRYKCTIASTRRALNWRAVFSSCCVRRSPFLWSLLSLLVFYRSELSHSFTHQLVDLEASHFIPFALTIWKVQHTPSQTERMRSVIQSILQVNAEINLTGVSSVRRKEDYRVGSLSVADTRPLACRSPFGNLVTSLSDDTRGGLCHPHPTPTPNAFIYREVGGETGFGLRATANGQQTKEADSDAVAIFRRHFARQCQLHDDRRIHGNIQVTSRPRILHSSLSNNQDGGNELDNVATNIERGGVVQKGSHDENKNKPTRAGKRMEGPADLTGQVGSEARSPGTRWLAGTDFGGGAASQQDAGTAVVCAPDLINSAVSVRSSSENEVAPGAGLQSALVHSYFPARWRCFAKEPLIFERRRFLLRNGSSGRQQGDNSPELSLLILEERDGVQETRCLRVLKSREAAYSNVSLGSHYCPPQPVEGVPCVRNGREGDKSISSNLVLLQQLTSGLRRSCPPPFTEHYNASVAHTQRYVVASDEALPLSGGSARGILNDMLLNQILASYHGKPGSIPGSVTPGFSPAEIVPENAAGRRVFSGISRFPRPCLLAPLHSHLISSSSTLNTLLLRVAQISKPIAIACVGLCQHHVVRESQYQTQFSLNVWTGVAVDMFICPYNLLGSLNTASWRAFSENDLPGLLLQRCGLWYTHCSAPGHFSRAPRKCMYTTYSHS